MSDSELVKTCLEGDKGSYLILMDRYKASAMAVAMNILVNREDAEDVCQEAFFKALQNLDRFDQQKSFRNWFYALLCNLCLDQIRKKRSFYHFLRKFRSEQPQPGLPRANDPGPDPLLKRNLLRHLSPKERTAMYLWAQEGYTGAEIASVLECSPKTAHVYLYKARRKLKDWLKENKNVRLQKI